ncbi:MAG: DegV family protein, partial [Caloramator sp.]|nr:DegV family protein [Caloramator sp.]
MGNIVIVTDSTADLSKEMIEENGIIVLPLTVTYKGRSYKDGVD